MMQSNAMLVLPLVLVALAGCLTVDDTPAAEPYNGEPIIVYDEGHDHNDPAQHEDSAFNARILDVDDLRRFGASDEIIVGAHAMAIHDDLLAVAVFGNHDDNPEAQAGFHLFDVSTPGRMKHLSYWEAPTSVRGDRTIAFHPEGTHVFLGFEGGARPGVAAVDVQDPENPVEVAFYADDVVDSGPHTVAAGMVGGVPHVFLLSYGVTILSFEDDVFSLQGKFVTQDELGAATGVRHLLPGDVEGPGYATTFALRSVYGHDMTFYNDPTSGKSFLSVAYGYDGFKVLDVSIPPAPMLEARFQPEADTAHPHYVHTASMERLEDGTLVVVVGTETFETENQGIPSPLWILDATDAATDGVPLTDMEAITKWTNPDGAPSGALGLSLHFTRLQDGLLYISHYHGGVWVLDVRTPELRANPEILAAIQPVPDNAVSAPENCCIGFDLAGVPMVFDVEVSAAGQIFAADIVQGVVEIQRFE